MTFLRIKRRPNNQEYKNLCFFKELQEILSYELIKRGYDDIKEAEEITIKIFENWRGINLTIPKNPKGYMEKQKRRAVEDLKNLTRFEVARKYGVTESILYKWEKEAIKNDGK